LAVIEGLSVLTKTIVLHPLHDLVEISPFEHAMRLGPPNHFLIRNKDFRLMARLCKRLFSSDAITMIEIAP
jgi:hypothetical protein